MAAEVSFNPQDDLLDALARDRDAIAERLTFVEMELDEMAEMTAKVELLRSRLGGEKRRLGALLGQLDVWLDVSRPGTSPPAAAAEPEVPDYEAFLEPWGASEDAPADDARPMPDYEALADPWEVADDVVAAAPPDPFWEVREDDVGIGDDDWGIADDDDVVPLWVQPADTRPIHFAGSPTITAPGGRVVAPLCGDEDEDAWGPGQETMPIELRPFELPGSAYDFSRRPRCSPASESP